MSQPADVSFVPVLIMLASMLNDHEDCESPTPGRKGPLDTVPGTSERELIQRLQADDDTAFEIIYRSLHPRLLAIAKAYVYSSEIAEDIAQDALVMVWNRRAMWSETDSLVIYLDVTVRNRARMHLRHEGVIGRLRVAARAEEAVIGTAGYVESAETVVERQDLLEIVKRAMQNLPDAQRTAFTLRWIHQLDYEEVGRAMGTSTATARKLVSRARSAIVALVTDNI